MLTKKEFFTSVKGKIFSVTFIKQDKSIRKLVGRTGVTRYIKHPDNPAKNKPRDPNNPYITVFDLQKHAYRQFNLDRVLEVKCGKFHYKREGELSE